MTMEDVRSGLLDQTVQVGPSDELIPAYPGSSTTRTPTFSPEYVSGSPFGSPAGLMRRLLAMLDARTPAMLTWDAYYRGEQPLAFASAKFRDAFGGRFRAFSSNFCSLVVDGTRERMEVTGFTFKTTRSTKRAWGIWQDNDMDAGSQMAHTELLIKGIVYALVTPTLDGPRITIEDPLDAITLPDPADRRVQLAGLKRWVDVDGHLLVYLYTPEYVWKLRSAGTYSPTTSAPPSAWTPAPQDGEPWPLPNPLGVVPLVPIRNRPRLKGHGQSEIDPVMSNQDAINKYRADALVAAEFGAFRQRWAIGLDIPEDPKTGRPIEPFKAAVDRLWVIPPPDPEDPNPPHASFGEFNATDLGPYQSMIESEVGAVSSISRLPYHYLLGQPSAVPPSGESLKSSEAGLVRKVRTICVHVGEGWEGTMRLALLAANDPGSKDRAAATSWADPETRNEGMRTDAVTKLKQSRIITTRESRVAVGYAPDPAADDPEATALVEPEPVETPEPPSDPTAPSPTDDAPPPPAAGTVSTA